MNYRGRLAPSPTGYLHIGHARTFWTAQRRAVENEGTLVLRVEDLDASRARAEFAAAMIEDLRWFGFEWQEGPDVAGAFAPYIQSERLERYRVAFERLREIGALYPCDCSRQDVFRALSAPHAGDDEPIYPGTCLRNPPTDLSRVSWRFRVPDGETITFDDGGPGPQSFTAGRDFGDFAVWRSDGLPAYQLACAVDDAAMEITDVVRGADLLLSTARQLLIYRALGLHAPAFYHCPLVTDEYGTRLAKRHDAVSLRRLRESGAQPRDLRRDW